MHARVMRVLALVIAGVVVLTSPSVVGAQTGGSGRTGGDAYRGDEPQPSDEFSHSESVAAFLVGIDAERARSSGVPSCRVAGLPDRPAHYDWWSFQASDGTWTVGLNCVFDEEITGRMGHPDGIFWGENLWSRPGVRAGEADLAAIVAEALARLRPGEAGIHTSPGDGVPSLVGIRTLFWVDEGVYRGDSTTMTDGPLSVRVWAEPTVDRRVRWDTGEDSFECPSGTAQQESCSAVYERSSTGQPYAVDGDAAYQVTATYSYVGGYEVFLGDVQVGSGALGQIDRTSQALLPVAEAQAINADR